MRYWKRLNNGEITGVESYSHNLDIVGAVEINETEFNALMDELKSQKPPPRNALRELDDLKAKLKSKGIID